MSIVTRAAPAAGRQIVHDALVHRLHRRDHLPALRGPLQSGTPLPTYVINRQDASGATPLSAAQQAGWAYPIVGGVAPALAMLTGNDARLEFAGISHGLVVERLLEAATLAEDNLAGTETFEPRLLEVPSLRLSVLWLRGTQSFFIVLVDGQRTPLQEVQIERDIQPRIEAALAASRTRASAARAATRRARPATRGRQDVRPALAIFGILAAATPFAPLWTHFLGSGPLLAWILELAWVLCLFGTAGIGAKRHWFGLLIDGRNKISLSRLQMVLWTIFFAATLFVVYVWNVGHVNPAQIADALGLTIPSAAWLLMGMSGVSAAGSPAILSAKAPPDPAAAPPPAPSDRTKFLDGMVVKRKAGETPAWSDILLGDEAGNADAIDISKVQQLLLSLVAIAVYAYAVAQILAAAKVAVVTTLPNMNGGFLTLIGVSHATYLVYKGVSHSN